jgi:hypothetical protein
VSTVRPEFLRRLTRVLAGRPSETPLAAELCRTLVEVVDGRDGAFAIKVSAAERNLLCATSDAAVRFEEAQDLVREGPSLEVLRTGLPLHTERPDDLRRRWPQLAETTQDLPARGLHVLAMRPGDAVIGVVAIHHDFSQALRAPEQDLQFFANTVGAAIFGEMEQSSGTGLPWTERDRISQATGMVIAQMGVPPDDAMAVLRAHAYAQGVSVSEVSRRVVERVVSFRPRTEGP